MYTRLTRYLSTTFGMFGSLAIVIMTTAVALDVAARTVTGRGIDGVLEAVDPLLVIAAFMGLAITQRRDEHVALTLLTRRLAPRLRYTLISFGMLLCILLFVWMAMASTELAIESIERGEVRAGIVSIPMSPARIAVSLGCVALCLELVRSLTDAVRSAIAGVAIGQWKEREDNDAAGVTGEAN